MTSQFQSSINSSLIFQAIKSADNKTAKALVQKIINKFQTLLDTQNSSLLHIATNNNNLQLVEFLLQKYDKRIQQQPQKYNLKQKKKWINKKDNQGFNCLHYAVFRANQKIAFLLEKNGSDIYSINTQGLSVLHIAAQGDSPVLMYYYLNKGLKLSVMDSKGSTALHWACYSGQQNAVNALLSWGAQIDCQDFTYGMTPLHLAVMSGNGKIVKKLLIRGCNRNLANYSGKLPLDIAKQNQYKNITQMILDKRGISQFLNIKNPFRKINKRTVPFYLFMFLFLTNYIFNISFVLPHQIKIQTQLGITFLALGLIVLILFTLSSLKSPGYLRPDESKDYFSMLLNNKPSSICFDCKIVKPPRSRHCDICDSCVKVYDHHCPWLGNCVGANNYKYFFMFLLSIQTFIFYSIFFQIWNLQSFQWQQINFQHPLILIQLVCIFYGLITSLLFVLPLTFLVYVQLKNLLTNKTTFQRFGYQNNSTKSSHRSSNMSQSSMKSSLLKSDTNSLFGEKDSTSDRVREEIEIKWSTNCYSMMCSNGKNKTYQIQIY